jgi:hypothetical protein
MGNATPAGNSKLPDQQALQQDLQKFSLHNVPSPDGAVAHCGTQQTSEPRRATLAAVLPGSENASRSRNDALARGKGQYQVLLFALEDPKSCAHVMRVKLPNSQCSLLKEWAITSQPWKSIDQPTTSKNLLHTEFEKLKARVAVEMETHSIQSSLNADTEV